MNIPFAKTTFGPEEEKAVIDVMRSGWVVQGPKVKEFEEKFAEFVGAKYAVMVNSGTSALDLSVKYWKHKGELGDGGSIAISVPSLTFTATAEVIIHNNLVLDFTDVEDDMLVDTLEYPGNTYLPVHLCGNKKEGGFLIEDSAHMILPGQCKDSAGLVCFSLYATKNISTVQGGMIATNSEEAYKWLKLARDHGVSKGTSERYKDGKWAYDIEMIGWRCKSDDVAAAIGLEQLKKLPWINEQRQRVVELYNKELGLTNTGLHLYPVLVKDRDEFIEFMKYHGVQCSVHFLPLHQMTAYKKIVGEVSLPKTEYFGQHLVSLPLYPDLSDTLIKYICKRIEEANSLGFGIIGKEPTTNQHLGTDWRKTQKDTWGVERYELNRKKAGLKEKTP